jgi:serine/threonine protein phosphatase PrpC
MKRLFKWIRRRFSRPSLHMSAASLSERGLVRRDNQDHIFVRRSARSYCVADGMGGGEGGAEASRIVCSALSSAVADNHDFAERVRGVAEAIHASNTKIREFAASAGYRQMATTVTIFLVDPGNCRSGVVGHVGDSRVYRFRKGSLVRLTHDHTLAGELERSAVANALAGDLGGRRHVIAHMLTRAVGLEKEVQPDWRKIDIKSGDWFLLCSDGVYDMVPDSKLEAAIAAGGMPHEVVRRIADEVVAAGAEDNYSMVIIRAGGQA